MTGEGIFRPISGDGEIPDRELRDLCVFWIRAIQYDRADTCAEKLAIRILETPATCPKGVSYKIAAAATTAAFKLGEDHPIALFLMSAIEDYDRLRAADPDVIERLADQTVGAS